MNVGFVFFYFVSSSWLSLSYLANKFISIKIGSSCPVIIRFVLCIPLKASCSSDLFDRLLSDLLLSFIAGDSLQSFVCACSIQSWWHYECIPQIYRLKILAASQGQIVTLAKARAKACFIISKHSAGMQHFSLMSSTATKKPHKHMLAI